jgi:hypothetical protein
VIDGCEVDPYNCVGELVTANQFNFNNYNEINYFVEKKRGNTSYIPTLKEGAPESDFYRLKDFKIAAPTTCMSNTGVLSITFSQAILNFNRINCKRTLKINL